MKFAYINSRPAATRLAQCTEERQSANIAAAARAGYKLTDDHEEERHGISA